MPATPALAHALRQSVGRRRLMDQLFVLLGMAMLWRDASARGRRWLALAIAAGSLYAVYMFAVDVPMYWARWQADQAAGRLYPTLAAGLADAIREAQG